MIHQNHSGTFSPKNPRKSASLTTKKNEPYANSLPFDKNTRVQEEKGLIKIDIEDSSVQDVSLVSTQAEEPSLRIQRPAEPEVIISPIPANQEAQALSSSSTDNSALESAKQACFLRKVCAILLSMIMLTISIFHQTDVSQRLEILSVVVLCCLMYMTLENLVFCLTQDLGIDEYKERLFDVLDGLIAIYFIFIIKFRGEEKTSNYLLIASPCLYLILTSIYAKQSTTSNKRKKIYIKLCCTIQATLIAARILGYINLYWMIIVAPLALCLVSHQIYGCWALIKSFARIYHYYKNAPEIRSLSLIKSFLQISWYMLYYGLSSLVLVILVNICMQMDKLEIFESVTIFFRITKYCSFFLGYTLIFSKLMKKFDININGGFEIQIDEEMPAKTKGYSLIAKGGLSSSSFQRISSTYFIKRQSEGNFQISAEKFEEKTLCYICEINKPNVILMGCGHGGMCKDCVLLSMKKNSYCMECRRPVKAIYQIKKEDKKEGIVEAVEAYNVVYSL